MAHRYQTSPLDDDPGQKFSFGDATLLAFIGVVALALVVVFLLGSICAEHRIAAELAVL